MPEANILNDKAECVQCEVEAVDSKQNTEQSIPLLSIPSCASCLDSFGGCIWTRLDVECLKFWNQVKKNRGEL